MGLSQKYQQSNIDRTRNEYEISLLNEYRAKFIKGEIVEKTRTKRPTLAYRIATSKSEEEMKVLLRVQNKLSDKESKIAYRNISAMQCIDNDPNYFLTLSMDACFDNSWYRYDRDRKTLKLYRSIVVLIKKLFLKFDPTLKDKPFEEWPFFIAVMEHFDDQGNLVAPHMHILLKMNVDIKALRAAIEELWGKAVPEAGKNGINLQHLDSKGLPDRAHYVFKHAYQDHEFKLDNGVMPELVRQRYGWNREAVSHDMWLIRRENFRTALAGKSATVH